jgi:hypothetical protein
MFCSFGIILFAQEMSAKPAFAPGGLITVPPSIDYESVASRADMTELLAVLPEPDPELQNDTRFRPDIWATEIRIVRDVWCLQFSFKTLRIIEVDVPNAAGNFDKKKIWYLVYCVKNLGPADLDENKINSALGSAVPAGSETPLPVPTDITLENIQRSAPLVVRQQQGIFTPQPGNSEAIRFVPQFILATDRLVLGSEASTDPETGKTEWKTDTTVVAYVDSVHPLALRKIKDREKMEAMPETTVSIKDKTIAPGQEFWGVAMWTDVDPRINEFSIFVCGLTNAYKWSNNMEEKGEERSIKCRVLKLDWLRTGDAKSLNESQISFGSKDGTMPTGVFDQTGKRTPEERKRLEEAFQKADVNADGWISPAEKAVYHLIHQDWLKPTYGYEWVFW